MIDPIKIKEKGLKAFSNKELDELYATLSRGIENGEPSKTMKDIEAEMQSRYDDFNKTKK